MLHGQGTGVLLAIMSTSVLTATQPVERDVRGGCSSRAHHSLQGAQTLAGSTCHALSTQPAQACTLSHYTLTLAEHTSHLFHHVASRCDQHGNTMSVAQFLSLETLAHMLHLSRAVIVIACCVLAVKHYLALPSAALDEPSSTFTRMAGPRTATARQIQRRRQAAGSPHPYKSVWIPPQASMVYR